MSHRKRHHRIKLRSIYQWHRYIGVTVSLFAVLLAVSGILLNHTEELHLDSRYIESPWIQDWYGIKGPAHITAYPAGEHWTSQWDEQLYLDALPLGSYSARLRGAVMLGEILVVALEDQLLLLTPQGELIEKLNVRSGLPGKVHAIGITSKQQLLIKTASGEFASDSDMLSWSVAEATSTTWSKAKRLPEALHTSITTSYRGHGLSLERVLLDLHSGRIFGRLGNYVMDAVALLILFLALSGLWLWSKRILSNRKRQGKHQC